MLVVAIVSQRSGRTVTTLPAVQMTAYRHRHLSWDGRAAGGALAPPGTYTLAVHFVRAGQTVKPALTLHLEGSAA
jgi:hypothetical protein